MIITSITVQKRKKDRYNIFIDYDYSFSADSEDIAILGIEEGQSIDAEKLEHLIYLCQYSKAYNKALNILAQRSRSEHEIRSKLNLSGYCTNIVEMVVQKLKELKFIDDLEFSKSWVENRMMFNPAGRRKMISDLANLGINKETAESALYESQCDDLEVAKILAAKKIKSAGIDLKDIKALNRLYRYLLSKGISYDAAHKAIYSYAEKDLYDEQI